MAVGLRKDRSAAVALLLLYALLYLLPLGVRPLASPDEVRYGEIPHEMLASGDWISPHFNGVRYFEKPVLGYWLNAASLALLGETPFALRLPVAIATGLTALIVLALARRFLTPFAARLAACIFLTTSLVVGAGTFAVLDAFLALFLTAALASYYLAIEHEAAEAERPFRRHAYLALCGAACGAAFLVKGFLAFAIPALVAAVYLIARRRWRTLWLSPMWPIAAAAVAVLPWAVAIQVREPDYWRYFFWVQHIQRFAGSHAQHARPFWFYLACLPLVGLPWILLLPAALLGLRRTRREGQDGGNDIGNGLPRHDDSLDMDCALGSDRSVGIGDTAATRDTFAGGRRETAFLWYLAAWAGLPLLFFSLAKGKLPTYLLPCFAPLAILLAAGLERYLAAPRQRAFRVGACLLAAGFAAVSFALLGVQSGVFGPPVFAPDEGAKLAACLGCMLLGTCCAAYAGLGASRVPRLAALAIAGAALILPLQLAVPRRVLEDVAPSTVIRQYARAAADTLVVSDSRLFGATAWVLKRDDIYVLSPGEIEYGLNYPDSRYRLLDGAGLLRLIEANRERHAILIVCQPATARSVAKLLPPYAWRLQRGAVVFWHIPARSGGISKRIDPSPSERGGGAAPNEALAREDAAP